MPQKRLKHTSLTEKYYKFLLDRHISGRNERNNSYKLVLNLLEGFGSTIELEDLIIFITPTAKEFDEKIKPILYSLKFSNDYVIYKEYMFNVPEVSDYCDSYYSIDSNILVSVFNPGYRPSIKFTLKILKELNLELTKDNFLKVFNVAETNSKANFTSYKED